MSNKLNQLKEFYKNFKDLPKNLKKVNKGSERTKELNRIYKEQMGK